MNVCMNLTERRIAAFPSMVTFEIVVLSHM